MEMFGIDIKLELKQQLVWKGVAININRVPCLSTAVII